jgi:hypothetical protein
MRFSRFAETTAAKQWVGSFFILLEYRFQFDAQTG